MVDDPKDLKFIKHIAVKLYRWALWIGKHDINQFDLTWSISIPLIRADNRRINFQIRYRRYHCTIYFLIYNFKMNLNFMIHRYRTIHVQITVAGIRILNKQELICRCQRNRKLYQLWNEVHSSSKTMDVSMCFWIGTSGVFINFSSPC